MLRCDLCQQWLMDGSLDVSLVQDAEQSEMARLVAEHLRECPSCQELCRDLALVDESLRARPRIQPTYSFRSRIMARIAMERSPAEERWQLMPWTIWVPAVAFVLVMWAGLTLAPISPLSGHIIGDLQPSISHWPTSIIDLGNALMTTSQDQAFWIAWTALFAAGAGLGIRLALSHWNAANASSLHQLEHQVTDAATQIWNNARRAL